MKRKDDSMMLFVSDDSLDDSDDDNEDLILVILDDSEPEVWILIWEICLDDSSGEDSGDDELRCVNERISKKLLKSALKIHIYDVKRK